jgi:hypothetical protein
MFVDSKLTARLTKHPSDLGENAGRLGDRAQYLGADDHICSARLDRKLLRIPVEDGDGKGQDR